MAERRSRRKADMKVAMVGDESVGKTCLVLRYIDRHFQESVSTIGASFVLKQWGNYNIALWDTAGGERYSGLSTFYYRNASAAILVFDMFDRNTFDNLNQRYIPILNNVSCTKLKVIVATKRDLLATKRRQVSEKEGIELAKRNNPHVDLDGFIPYFETSSRTGTNVDEMFEFIFNFFYPNKGSLPKPMLQEKMSISLDDNTPQKKIFSCC